MHDEFDPRFFERHPLFWPIAPAAAAFAGERDWPPVCAYARAFAATGHAPPVRFEEARPRTRRRRSAVDVAGLYDSRIVREGCVPTRPRSWHDFLNALVWATFPRAKRALHARQHRALGERIAPGARTLPATRSREHDAIALLDEGGVVVASDGADEALVIFGHAVYESIVRGRWPVTSCTVAARVDAVRSPDRLVAAADAALAGCFGGAQDLDPARLSRVTIPRDAARRPSSVGLDAR